MIATSTTTSFQDFEYVRPDLESLEKEFREVLGAIKVAKSLADAKQGILAIDQLRGRIATMSNICHIRYTINTKDEFYAAEKDWGDQHYPATEAWKKDFYELLLNHPLRAELEAEFGQQLFKIAELSMVTFRPEILPDLQQENKLSSEFVQLKASAEIELDGETYNLSQIHTKEIDPDRAIRRRAAKAKWRWYAEKQDELDGIFDGLVKTRTAAARSLGFDNFVELGYARMLRTDYNEQMVKQFRRQVVEHIVPLANQLYERQRERLGLEELHYYDENFRFPGGNPKPQGPPDWILDQARGMYDELAPETSQFFRLLEDRNLMDVVAKDGKATGGYCTYISDHGAPFIFSNFNGTSGDIDVLTHEFGHAFQVYSSRHLKPLEYNWPTYEACEIHSMSMEFFTYPWMDKFFGPDSEKYYFSHLAGAVRFIPYGVAVDEFQHRIYAEPDLSPAQRHAVWRELEEKYLPHRNYAGNEFLEQGAFWIRQNHIFSAPFYYIDYCLAQICAFQFWARDRQDHSSAWNDYLRLCKAGGSKSFLGLVKLAGLKSPFAAGTVEQTLGVVREELNAVNGF
ncbi:M3 family oligoendopeptidase [Lewinellaceae bacterium SD302]|nr:M3 family oligoendopeptidase [Lewinellaceae bacterium SD302]